MEWVFPGAQSGGKWPRRGSTRREGTLLNGAHTACASRGRHRSHAGVAIRVWRMALEGPRGRSGKAVSRVRCVLRRSAEMDRPSREGGRAPNRKLRWCSASPGYARPPAPMRRLPLGSGDADPHGRVREARRRRDVWALGVCRRRGARMRTPTRALQRRGGLSTRSPSHNASGQKGMCNRQAQAVSRCVPAAPYRLAGLNPKCEPGAHFRWVSRGL